MTLKRTAALFVLLCLARHPAIAQEFVSQARELYFTAHYEEALKALAAIETDTDTERQVVREYRVLCLIGLDRLREAIEIIEQMIDADPFYQPAAEHRPPRVITLFDQIRRHRLPWVGRERYARATNAFDEHRDADAAYGFTLVLRLVEEAKENSSGEQGEHELTTLKTYATRFLELTLARQRQTAVSVQRVENTFGSTDSSVTPPVPIRQEIPSWPSQTLGSMPFEGELEVIIDAAGDVRETRLTTQIHPVYDALILDSAKGWKYRPATKDGRAVAYRMLITINLMPQRRLDSVQSWRRRDTTSPRPREQSRTPTRSQRPAGP